MLCNMIPKESGRESNAGSKLDMIKHCPHHQVEIPGSEPTTHLRKCNASSSATTVTAAMCLTTTTNRSRSSASSPRAKSLRWLGRLPGQNSTTLAGAENGSTTSPMHASKVFVHSRRSLATTLVVPAAAPTPRSELWDTFGTRGEQGMARRRRMTSLSHSAFLGLVSVSLSKKPAKHTQLWLP